MSPHPPLPRKMGGHDPPPVPMGAPPLVSTILCQFLMDGWRYRRIGPMQYLPSLMLSSLKTGPARPGHTNFVIGGLKESKLKLQHLQ